MNRRANEARLARALRPLRCALCLLLACVAPPRASAQTPKLRPADPPPDLVRLTLSVTDDYGRYVTGLERNAFTLLVDEKVSEIAEFSDEEEPVSFALILALSGPPDSALPKAVGEALTRFTDTGTTKDEFFLIGEESHLRTFSTSPEKFAQRIPGGKLVRANPGQGLYDLCAFGVETLRRGGRHGKRALLLVTNQPGPRPRVTFAELRALLGKSDVALHSLYIADWEQGGERENQLVLDLDELTTITGGRAYFVGADNAQLTDHFERLAIELRALYTIGFKPPAGEGGWHKIKIRVLPPRGIPDLFMRHKEFVYRAGPSVPARPTDR